MAVDARAISTEGWYTEADGWDIPAGDPSEKLLAISTEGYLVETPTAAEAAPLYVFQNIETGEFFLAHKVQ